MKLLSRGCPVVVTKYVRGLTLSLSLGGPKVSCPTVTGVTGVTGVTEAAAAVTRVPDGMMGAFKKNSINPVKWKHVRQALRQFEYDKFERL